MTQFTAPGRPLTDKVGARTSPIGRAGTRTPVTHQTSAPTSPG
jgi:hypothetical protein